MATTKIVHACGECGAEHPKWSGRCTSCGAWNSLVAEPVDRRPSVSTRSLCDVQLLGDVDALVGQPRPTGIGELDRVLGGGVVPGSVTLLGGEPGIGKSTLVLQLMAWWPGPTLYVSAEESPQQVRLRAERLGAVRPELWVVSETTLEGIVAAFDAVHPELVVVDSIQTIADGEIGSAPGTVTQVRECAQRLVVEAKRRQIAVVIVGHVTKDGSLAGPRLLEHLVDTVLAFEGERHHALRLLRAVKHRFGPTSELGLFEMTGAGLVGVPDPSRLFLADRRSGAAGSTVAATIEGHRPLVVEVQSLTNAVANGVPPRRNVHGVDGARMALLLAVLERRGGIRVANQDVYASTVGGVRLAEPGTDLAVCLAVASAVVDRPLPPDIVAIGEVGLGGEIRQVSQAPRRLAEALRLGFARALVPPSAPVVDGIAAAPVATIGEALAAAGLVGSSR